MTEVTLAACNMRVTHDVTTNLDRMLGFMGEAAQRGVDLLVFPEMALQGYADFAFRLGSPGSVEQKRYYHRTAEPIPGESTAVIQQHAAECGLVVQVGLAERAASGNALFNSVALIDGSGVLGVYRKLHNRFEFPYFDPGESTPVFRSPLGRVGSLICYDIAFPELTRVLAVKGARIVLMSAAWPMKGHDIEDDDYGRAMDLAVRANTFFNQIWLVVADHCETGVYSERLDYYGSSKIVDPNGVVVASLGREEGLVVHTADIDESILESRTERYFGLDLLQDRRPHLYQELLRGPDDHLD